MQINFDKMLADIRIQNTLNSLCISIFGILLYATTFYFCAMICMAGLGIVSFISGVLAFLIIIAILYEMFSIKRLVCELKELVKQTHSKN